VKLSVKIKKEKGKSSLECGCSSAGDKRLAST